MGCGIDFCDRDITVDLFTKGAKSVREADKLDCKMRNRRNECARSPFDELWSGKLILNVSITKTQLCTLMHVSDIFLRIIKISLIFIHIQVLFSSRRRKREKEQSQHFAIIKAKSFHFMKVESPTRRECEQSRLENFMNYIYDRVVI